MVRTALAFVCVLVTFAPMSASGALGIYGIVERVVFEPATGQPERLQLWGAFAWVEGDARIGTTVSEAKRGYLYFRMPTAAEFAASRTLETIRNEWSDFKVIAGTGQAVGFGSWGYIGAFEGLKPDVRSRNPPYVIEQSVGRPVTDLRVRAATEQPGSPALYQTQTGLVKLSESGSHAAIVKALKAALKR